ncbi:MAG: recombinase family protein [Elusimicrobiota bacterium]
MKKCRTAIYARVSSKKDQTPENQLLELRRYAEARGWTIFEEFVDHGVSGAKDSRPALNRLMDAARKRKIDRILVSRFDRFGRSVKHLILSLEEFRTLGVEFTSLADNIDTATPMGRMAFTMIAAVAQFERELIRERIHSGLRRARAQGKRLGRPRKAVDDSMVLVLRKRGQSLRQIGRSLGISKDAVANILSVMGTRNGAGSSSGPIIEKGLSA